MPPAGSFRWLMAVGWVLATVSTLSITTLARPTRPRATRQSVTVAVQPEDESQTLGSDLSVERIADEIWRHVSYIEMPEYGRTPANGLVVLSGEEAALINTPWTDEQTRRLVDWIAHRREAHLRIVVPTHSHADCMGGLKAAHALGARSYASDHTLELARQQGLEVPQNGFETETTVRIGQRELRLHYPGKGHTVDNIVVWIPAAKVLFGGCLVKSATATGLGYTKEADLAAWPKTLETVLAAYPDARLVVPGHGDPGGLDLLRHTLDLLQQLR